MKVWSYFLENGGAQVTPVTDVRYRAVRTLFFQTVDNLYSSYESTIYWGHKSLAKQEMNYMNFFTAHNYNSKKSYLFR